MRLFLLLPIFILIWGCNSTEELKHKNLNSSPPIVNKAKSKFSISSNSLHQVIFEIKKESDFYQTLDFLKKFQPEDIKNSITEEMTAIQKINTSAKIYPSGFTVRYDSLILAKKRGFPLISVGYFSDLEQAGKYIEQIKEKGFPPLHGKALPISNENRHKLIYFYEYQKFYEEVILFQ